MISLIWFTCSFNCLIRELEVTAYWTIHTASGPIVKFVVGPT